MKLGFMLAFSNSDRTSFASKIDFIDIVDSLSLSLSLSLCKFHTMISETSSLASGFGGCKTKSVEF